MDRGSETQLQMAENLNFWAQGGFKSHSESPANKILGLRQMLVPLLWYLETNLI